MNSDADVTVAEAAALLGISPKGVYFHIKKGHIPAHRSAAPGGRYMIPRSALVTESVAEPLPPVEYPWHVVERFWEKVDKSGGPDACWVWMASRWKGGGQFGIRGKPRSAHRIAYEVEVGAIPDAFIVRHRCDNCFCVNPSHLTLGSEADNRRDLWRGVRAGERTITAKTHVPDGYTPQWTSGQIERQERQDRERFESKIQRDAETGCWLWTGPLTKKGGYGSFGMGGRNGRNYRAHRLAYEWYRGPIPEGSIVLHLCDTPRCVNPDHLRLGTPADNSHDMASKGRSTKGDRNPSRLYPERRARGERSGSAKLTEEAVRTAWRLRTEGKSYQAIGNALGVTWGAVYHVLKRETWIHVEPSADLSELGDRSRCMERGTQRYNAKLDDEKVRELRLKRSAGVKLVDLAHEYGVSHGVVSAVVQRRAWKHVD